MLWTDAERARLRELRPHMGLREIALELRRPKGSVAHESARLKLFRPRGASWTLQEMEKIARWWPDYSATQIGEKLGRSRNAVIGVIHRSRKKLKLKPKTTAHPPGRSQPCRVSLPKPKPPPPRQPMPPAVPMQCHCQLVELDDINCKWPHGDPHMRGFYFCGAVAVGGRPYCATHLRIAHEQEPRHARRSPPPQSVSALANPAARS